MIETTVLIIGAGIGGTAIARELSRYEMDVLVVEREAEVGWGTHVMGNLQIHVTTSVSEIAQAAALAALEGPSDWLESAKIVYQKRRDRLVAGLNGIEGITCLKPEGGRCAFPNISALGMGTLAFARMLLKKKSVHVIPTVEKHYGSRAEQACKIGFCKPVADIDAGLERIREVLSKG